MLREISGRTVLTGCTSYSQICTEPLQFGVPNGLRKLSGLQGTGEHTSGENHVSLVNPDARFLNCSPECQVWASLTSEYRRAQALQ
jgi:hypothetical protein